MLVLTVAIGEKIHIGDDVSILVSSVRGGRFRIGIEAPRNVSVKRESIYIQNKESNDGVPKAKQDRLP